MVFKQKNPAYPAGFFIGNIFSLSILECKLKFMIFIKDKNLTI